MSQGNETQKEGGSQKLSEWETIDVKSCGDAAIRGIDTNEVTGKHTSMESVEGVPTVDDPPVIVSHKELEDRPPQKEKKRKKKGEGAN